MKFQDENGVTEEDDSDEANIPGQGGVPTPPDSPSPGLHGEFEFDGRIIPEIDIYAIPSNPSKCHCHIHTCVFKVLRGFKIKLRQFYFFQTLRNVRFTSLLWLTCWLIMEWRNRLRRPPRQSNTEVMLRGFLPVNPSSMPRGSWNSFRRQSSSITLSPERNHSKPTKEQRNRGILINAVSLLEKVKNPFLTPHESQVWRMHHSKRHKKYTINYNRTTHIPPLEKSIKKINKMRVFYLL